MLGYWWSGRAIASLHRYAHHQSLVLVPQTAEIYRLYHLAHHREEPREIVVVSKRLSIQEWVKALCWAVPFALFNSRWTAIRTLIGYRSIQVFITLLAAMSAGLPFASAILGTIGFLLGAYACLIAYDLCHQWTHVGGPKPSKLHADHHRRPWQGYGMWQWHNDVGIRSMHRTIASLDVAERILRRIPAWHHRVEKALATAHHTYQSKLLGRG